MNTKKKMQEIENKKNRERSWVVLPFPSRILKWSYLKNFFLFSYCKYCQYSKCCKLETLICPMCSQDGHLWRILFEKQYRNIINTAICPHFDLSHVTHIYNENCKCIMLILHISWILYFDLSNVTLPEIKNLRKLASAPNIPIDQLRVQIAHFKHINPDMDRPWIYYVGGGSGSGLVLLIVICCLLYWFCRKTLSQKTWLPACVTNTAPENPHMLQSRVGAIDTDKYLVPGQEIIGIQDPVGTEC